MNHGIKDITFPFFYFVVFCTPVSLSVGLNNSWSLLVTRPSFCWQLQTKSGWPFDPRKTQASIMRSPKPKSTKKPVTCIHWLCQSDKNAIKGVAQNNAPCSLPKDKLNPDFKCGHWRWPKKWKKRTGLFNDKKWHKFHFHHHKPTTKW